jgi:hypothetical protein
MTLISVLTVYSSAFLILLFFRGMATALAGRVGRDKILDHLSGNDQPCDRRDKRNAPGDLPSFSAFSRCIRGANAMVFTAIRFVFHGLDRGFLGIYDF